MQTRTMVVIINGIKESGKDTFVRFVDEYCELNECANIFNLSSVDPIKETLMQFGWEGEKSDEIRDLIAGIKKLWIGCQNGPTMYLLNNAMQFHIQHAGEDNLMFCHIREPEEIDKLKCALNGMDVIGLNVMTMLVDRPEKHGNSNPSRSQDDRYVIESYDYDYVVNNNSTLDKLKGQAECFVNKYIMEEM